MSPVDIPVGTLFIEDDYWVFVYRVDDTGYRHITDGRNVFYCGISRLITASRQGTCVRIPDYVEV